MEINTKERYEALLNAGELQTRGIRSNILDNPIISRIKEAWSSSVENGKSIIPFDMKIITQDLSTNLDFVHQRDKFRRCVQIATLSELFPSEIEKCKGIWTKETTSVLSTNLDKVRFKSESSQKLNECFVSLI